MVPNLEAMVIRVKKMVADFKCVRTAVIPCLNGFTAEVREIKPDPINGYWFCYLALVPKYFPKRPTMTPQ